MARLHVNFTIFLASPVHTSGTIQLEILHPVDIRRLHQQNVYEVHMRI